MFMSVAVLLSLATPIVAQQSDLMKIDVPFNFVAENQRMLAGAYTIQRMQNGRLLVRSADSTIATTVLSLPVPLQDNAAESQVVFHRYGSDYFLAEIRVRGQNTGREVLRGKEETQIAHKGIPRVLASLAAH
jgi:hypothetical protein